MRFGYAFAIFVALLSCAPAFAGDPLAGAGELIMTGRATEARALLSEARDAFVAQSDRNGEAVTTLLLGMTEMALGDSAAARANLGRAETMFVAAGDPFGAWLAVTTLAQFETQSGRPREALVLHERSFQWLEAAADPASRMSPKTIEVLGIVFGAPQEQVQLLMTTPELAQLMMIPLCAVMSRIAYGQTLLATGDLEKADDELTRAAAKGAMYGGVLDGMLATPMGDLRKRQWRFDDAREYYETALATSAMAMTGLFRRSSSAEIDVLGKLAEIDVLTGRVEEALARNDREQALARDSEPAREPWILIERGSLLQKAGRVSDAEKAYGRALAAGERLHDGQSRAAVHADLGRLYFSAGSYGKSAAALVTAIEILQELKERPAEAVLWTLLADVYLTIDSHEAAAEAISRARETATASQFPIAGAIADFLDAMLSWRRGEPTDIRAAFARLKAAREAQGLAASDEANRFMAELAAMNLDMTPPDPARMSGDGVEVLHPMALMMKGVPLAVRGDYAGARAVWSSAKELLPSEDLEAVFEGLIGMSHRAEGNIDEAIRHLERSTAKFDTVAMDGRVEEILTSYLGSERHQFFEQLIELLVRAGRIGEAFEQTERARARAFLQMIGNRRVGEHGADPRLAREADIQRRRIAAMDRLARTAVTESEANLSRRELVAARHEYEALMVRVKLSNPEYAALTTVETVPVDSIGSEIPERTTLITYFVTRNSVHAWVIDPETVNHVMLPIDAAALRRLACWARQFNREQEEGSPRGLKAVGDDCSDAATAGEAYAMLIAPLRAKIRYSRLAIVPHRELHYVPFAALLDGERNRYLIEDYTIVYAPSASAWRFLRRYPPPVSSRALVLGNPLGSIGALEGAGREAEMVARRLDTTPLLGSDACERLLHDLDRRVDLLHIAAHARYDGANPLFSFIALAAEGEQYDGNLEAQEILADVDLTGVDLVVVSACSTATGKPSAGDEIVGLTRALLYAGTPAVVSTLWDINDSASAVLMDVFYEGLVCGLPTAEALRNAQLSMLHRDGLESPRYWAQFILNGDPDGTWQRGLPPVRHPSEPRSRVP